MLLSLFWLSLTHVLAANHASTKLPAGLYRQLPRVAGQPLYDCPVKLLRQFLPAGTYHVRFADGHRGSLTIEILDIRASVGKLFELKAVNRIYLGGGSLRFDNGTAVVRRGPNGWVLAYDLSSPGMPTEYERKKDPRAALYTKFELRISPRYEVRGLSWDTENLAGERRHGSLTFFRQRPPPSSRCDLLTTASH